MSGQRYWFGTVLWIGLLVSLFWGLGGYPLTDVDEGAFAQASLEMLRRGDWVSPWLYGEPRFDKPAMIHWLQMTSVLIFGETPFAVRLPSAIAGLAWVWGVMRWARDLIGDHRGSSQHDDVQATHWALLLSIGSIGLIVMSRVATADALLNALLTWVLYCCWQAFFNQRIQFSQDVRRWGRRAAFLVSLGLLTKGPVAGLVPAGGLLTSLGLLTLLAPKTQTVAIWRRLLIVLKDPIAWALLLGPAAPWYWAQYQAQGQAFVDGFLGKHNLGRFTQTMHGFSGSVLYYPVWTAVACLPVLPLVLNGLVRFLRPSRLADPTTVFPWAVWIFVLVFFSFSATKLPHYGFYGLAGLLAVLAASTGRVGPGRITVTVSAVWALLWLLTLLAAPYWLPLLTPNISDDYIRLVLVHATEALLANRLLSALVAGVVLLMGAVGWLQSRRFGSIVPIGSAVLAATLCLHLILVPNIIQALRGPIVEIGQKIQTEKLMVVAWRMSSPSLSFQAGRVIPNRLPTDNEWVVFLEKNTAALDAAIPGLELVDQSCRTGICLAKATASSASSGIEKTGTANASAQ